MLKRANSSLFAGVKRIRSVFISLNLIRTDIISEKSVFVRKRNVFHD